MQQGPASPDDTLAALCRGRVVLDLCGTGAAWLSEARLLVAPGPRILVADPWALPLAPASVDVVLGPADAAEATLHEMRRVLRTDGTAVFRAWPDSPLVPLLFGAAALMAVPGAGAVRPFAGPARPGNTAHAAGLWQQVLDGHRAQAALQRQVDELAAAPARHDAVAEAALAAERAASRAALDAQVAATDARTRQVAEVMTELAAVYASTSWWLTGPMRGLGLRNPALVRAWRRLLPRDPRTGAIGGWRRRPAAPMPAVTAPPAPVPAPAPDPVVPDRTWLYAGDTFDWLSAGFRLTGVGRVTTELLLAGGGALHPCDRRPDGGLVAVSPADAAAFLRGRTRPGPATLPRPPAGPVPVRPGDHVLFTGTAWAPDQVALARDLSANGIRFSLLVYDLIPVLHPEMVDAAHRTLFDAFLRQAAAAAHTVFVPGATVADAVRRWALLSGVTLRAQIVPVPFGPTLAAIAAAPLAARPFVLSVGTVDRRKNQRLLCRLWLRLLHDRGPGAVPCLVLVGRDDLALRSDPAFAPLRAAGLLAGHDGLDDAGVSALLHGCLFTAVPSLAEGYGLAVSESLAAGKLCLAAALPEIREQAGDAPWYFDPADEEAAYALLCRALDDPSARQAVERRLRERGPAPGWDRTVAIMADAMRNDPPPALVPPASRPVPGMSPDAGTALRRAAAWCGPDGPDVSILLVNRDATAGTLACVRQVWAATEGVRYEIVVADNGSDPASLAPLRALGRGVRLLALGTDRYCGEARNIAAEAAHGRVLCLLDTGTFVQPGWLPALLRALDDPAVGVAGPLALRPDGTAAEMAGFLDAAGTPVPLATLREAEVDFVPGAAMLVMRARFLALGGFDPAYEPGGYEDADLCLRMRAAGHRVRFCPDARVVHDGEASPAHAVNRGKLVARWGRYLRSRDPADLASAPRRNVAAVAPGRPVAALFTPYPLTPGGGERFLLTAAAVLAADHDVRIVTPHPYSTLRLAALAEALGLDLSACRPQPLAELEAGPRPDLLLAMGNAIVPPLPPLGRRNLFVCQFPFPFDAAGLPAGRQALAGYDRVVAYSGYARAHVLAAMDAHGMPPVPVTVVHPPVPQPDPPPGLDDRGPVILSVARFFRGAHAKRQDRLIEALRTLRARGHHRASLHLVGSFVPDHMDYVAELTAAAADLPVRFHFHATPAVLAGLFRRATVLWHAAGLDADLRATPGGAEHFGIAVAEAMASGCIPVAFDAGGPRELVTDGVDGFLFQDLPGLVDRTAQLLDAPPGAVRDLRQAAMRRAAAFSVEHFASALRALPGIQA